ncbi:hypothetical protein [Bradyrhizobium jicamae]|uniref:hypothetical protein n=1 Tax=Bradyrhizobium jicamae TaxID=280332 RepID=UPI000A44EC9A|nr:hypothetical protein [Bradyrhizobium jicamae]
MPLISGAAAVLALQLGMPAVQHDQNEVPVVQVRGGSCGHGYDVDIHGRCYPNGVIPPQYQAARQGYAYYPSRRYYREEYPPRRRHYYRDY